jgi:hypothetical protein
MKVNLATRATDRMAMKANPAIRAAVIIILNAVTRNRQGHPRSDGLAGV